MNNRKNCIEHNQTHNTIMKKEKETKYKEFERHGRTRDTTP